MNNAKKLYRIDSKIKTVKVVDHNHLNNGGHDEFIIVKFGEHKSLSAKYCVIEYDIYGKSKSFIFSKEEMIEFFGEDPLN